MNVRKYFTVAACALLALGMQSVYYHTLATPSFRVKYEKNVSRRDAQKIGRMLDSAAVNLGRRLNLSFKHNVDVLLFKSSERLQNETGSKLFDDGLFRNGTIFLAVPKEPNNAATARDGVVRLVARVLLSQVPECPQWLAEAYGLYAGNCLERFGKPARSSILSFSDLAEDFVRSENLSDQKEVYAKLATTMTFLIGRYGEGKVHSMFSNFKTGSSLEQAFESAFGEKMNVIEKAWAEALAPSSK